MVKPEVLEELKKLETLLGQQALITSGYRPGDPGEHGKGLAVDVIFPTAKHSLFDIYLTAERLNFRGIGIYPDWQVNGVVYGGLHLDLRQEKPARWTGYRNNKTGKNEYGSLTKTELKRLGII